MKFYVATKFEEGQRARDVMAQLVQMGHEVTHDWTVYPQESPGAAEDDINGVVRADALLMLMEKDLPYMGTIVELGAALGTGKLVFILGDAPITKMMFCQHPRVVKIRSLDELNLR